MEVRVNTKIQILRSFLGWVFVWLASMTFYGIVSCGLAISALHVFLGFTPHQAMVVGLPIGGLILVLSVYAYLSWLVRSLSSYRLALEGDDLFVNGLGGWRRISKNIPIGSIQRVCLGETPTMAERVGMENPTVLDQVSSRLTFFPKEGKPFKIDFATKAFDSESLLDFFASVRAKGVGTNVGA